MHYPSSENQGADQLRGYREADLSLCFRLCRLLVFPWGGSFLQFISDFSYGEYGRGLYFSKFPSKAAQFSAVSTLCYALFMFCGIKFNSAIFSHVGREPLLPGY